MNLSAVVNIMLNKDKDIYLQESIEDGQYIMLSQPPEIQVKCLFHGQICDLENFKSHPVVIFRRTFPHVSPSPPPFSSHLTDLALSLRSSSFREQNMQHWSLRTLTQSTGWTYSTPHLTSLETYQMKTTGCSPSFFTCQKLLSLVCVTFQEQSAWPLLIRLEPGHSSWSAYFSQNALT